VVGRGKTRRLAIDDLKAGLSRYIGALATRGELQEAFLQNRFPNLVINALGANAEIVRQSEMWKPVSGDEEGVLLVESREAILP